jgi:hypothetical protein
MASKNVQSKSVEIPSFSKNYRDNGVWGTMVLTKEDEKEVREKHRQHILKIMRECYEDAIQITTNGDDIDAIALALFNKRADKVFTLLENRLTEKVNGMRKAGGFY